MLSNGRRVFVLGDESSKLSNGEISDLSDANPQWQPFNLPTGFEFVKGSVNGCILADGCVLFGGDGTTNQTTSGTP